MTVPLLTVLNELRLSNNGYTFVSNLPTEYATRAYQMAERGIVFIAKLTNTYGKKEDAFFCDRKDHESNFEKFVQYLKIRVIIHSCSKRT